MTSTDSYKKYLFPETFPAPDRRGSLISSNAQTGTQFDQKFLENDLAKDENKMESLKPENFQRDSESVSKQLVDGIRLCENEDCEYDVSVKCCECCIA